MTDLDDVLDDVLADGHDVLGRTALDDTFFVDGRRVRHPEQSLPSPMRPRPNIDDFSSGDGPDNTDPFVSSASGSTPGCRRTEPVTDEPAGPDGRGGECVGAGRGSARILHIVPLENDASTAQTSPLLALSTSGDDLDRVESAMHEAVVTSDAYLTEIASHLIVAGGKRLRPVLSTVAAQIVGDVASDDVVRGGVSCELVHLGSLYHDDVMDEADTRRGVETVNAKWGNLQAILAGDFLLSRASEIAASLGTEVAGLLARTIGWLCEGQIQELRHTYDIGRTEDSYYASIHGKTASLYGTAARIGGIVAEHDQATIDSLTDYGNAYGMVFQIVDDILDATATDEQLGKPAGHDMVEGVYTLPVLRTMALGSTDADELCALLGAALTPAQQQRALTIVRDNDGVASAVATAQEYVDRAAAACAAFPDTEATAALVAAPSALITSVSVTV